MRAARFSVYRWPALVVGGVVKDSAIARHLVVFGELMRYNPNGQRDFKRLDGVHAISKANSRRTAVPGMKYA